MQNYLSFKEWVENKTFYLRDVSSVFYAVDVVAKEGTMQTVHCCDQCKTSFETSNISACIGKVKWRDIRSNNNILANIVSLIFTC